MNHQKLHRIDFRIITITECCVQLKFRIPCGSGITIVTLKYVQYFSKTLLMCLQNLPEIKKYMESDAYEKLPMNNKGAKFGNKV